MGKVEKGGTYSTLWYCEKFMQNFQSLNLNRKHHWQTNMKEIGCKNVVWFQLVQDMFQ